MKFRVTQPNGRRAVTVEAEYYLVSDHGVLCFKVTRRNNYPLPLHTFAPGQWREVITLEEK
jgi:hypothetical protein